MKEFLRKELGPDSPNYLQPTQYIDAFVDLNGDGKKEVIVYLMGGGSCGVSGGCNMLILEARGSSYQVVTRTTVTREPIRVLASRSNGWRNIGVWVQGGGIQPGYEAELRFNGKKYPSNPSVPPARRLAPGVKGEVVIARDEEGKPLY